MGNSELAVHLKEFPSNAIYLSPDIQNELITLIGEEILSSISFEVKDVIKGNTVTELCIAIINQSNLKGKALADTVLSHLKSLKLPLEKMIGQGYDAASSMFGKEKDVPAIKKESCPLTVYADCWTQVLNSVLVKSCAILEIHSTFDFIGI